jgi:hypothetical protein
MATAPVAFLQRATDRGFTVNQIVARVFIVNLALLGLALATILLRSRMIDITAVSAGMALVALLPVARSAQTAVEKSLSTRVLSA